MDTDLLVDLLLMIISGGREDKLGMIQALFLLQVFMAGSLIHILLLLMLTEISARPMVKAFGFSQDGRTEHRCCISHMWSFIWHQVCMLQGYCFLSPPLTTGIGIRTITTKVYIKTELGIWSYCCIRPPLRGIGDILLCLLLSINYLWLFCCCSVSAKGGKLSRRGTSTEEE